jgi:hypothetical protein
VLFRSRKSVRSNHHAKVPQNHPYIKVTWLKAIRSARKNT